MWEVDLVESWGRSRGKEAEEEEEEDGKQMLSLLQSDHTGEGWEDFSLPNGNFSLIPVEIPLMRSQNMWTNRNVMQMLATQASTHA